MWGWVRKLFLRKRPIDAEFGVLKFIQNFAAIQVVQGESVTLNPPSGRVSDVTVVAAGGRPKLTYKYWPKRFEYREEMPVVNVILEQDRILLQGESGAQDDWSVVTINDSRIKPLHPMFDAFAFYMPMRAEHKLATKKDADAQKTN